MIYWTGGLDTYFSTNTYEKTTHITSKNDIQPKGNISQINFLKSLNLTTVIIQQSSKWKEILSIK